MATEFYVAPWRVAESMLATQVLVARALAEATQYHYFPDDVSLLVDRLQNLRICCMLCYQTSPGSESDQHKTEEHTVLVRLCDMALTVIMILDKTLSDPEVRELQLLVKSAMPQKLTYDDADNELCDTSRACRLMYAIHYKDWDLKTYECDGACSTLKWLRGLHLSVPTNVDNVHFEGAVRDFRADVLQIEGLLFDTQMLLQGSSEQKRVGQLPLPTRPGRSTKP